MFANVRNNEIIDFNTKYLDKDIIRIETTDDMYNAYLEDKDKVIYQDGELILDPNYEQEQLEKAKQEKLKLSLDKANDYINNVATYRDIETTDGNISKLTAYLIAMQQGLYQEIAWVTKSDNVITLTIEDVMDILENIGNVQTEVWTYKYIDYKDKINNCTTIEEVDNINIDYGL